MRLLRGSLVVGVVVAYLGHLFRVTQPAFWEAGLGDWLDPYFINYLLEHWRNALVRLADPSSPPMFFPVPHTLGYSHGLVLYAPFYVLSRLVLHPFQAYNATLVLVMAAGSLSLYGLLRTGDRVSCAEACLLTMCFLTSPNVTDGAAGIWSQRASVFLVPVAVLAAVRSTRLAQGRWRDGLAAVAGLLATLLFTQEFYTAMFTGLFVAAALPVALVSFRRGLRPPRRETPASAAPPRAGRVDVRWGLAFGIGALVGAAVFAWVYLDAYREHQAFPEGQLLASLIQRPPLRWGRVVQTITDTQGYASSRPFVLVALVAILAWVPGARVDRPTKLACLWALAVSLAVLVVPFRFGAFSAWRAWIAPLPGFAVIRDPKRIVYVFELAVALATAGFVSRVARGSWVRRVVSASVLALLVLGWNPVVYDFHRSNATFAHWVERNVAVDQTRQSFFVVAASPAYHARPHSGPTLPALDAMFVALRHGMPTLNGYSAWTPPGWVLAEPRDAGYPDAVRQWAAERRLEGVCAFDIEARTIAPHSGWRSHDSRLAR